MTQAELAKLISNQSARYGEPSTLRAIASYLRWKPRAAKFLNKLADERMRFYRDRNLGQWRKRR
jgi:hypothetical protein